MHPGEADVKLNSPDHLPPVGCPLLIQTDSGLLKAARTGYIEDKTRLMEYRLEDGSTIEGRYQWTYP